jgi:Protein of unknown function (DUF2934)
MATRQRGSNAQPSKQPPKAAAPTVVTIASSAEGGIAVGGMAADASARQQRIAMGAYLRAVERGFEPGHELEDWLAAERELEARGEIATAAPPPPL